MISAEQLRVFEERGAVTIDTPLTTKEIAAAAAAIDALLPFKPAEPNQAPRFRYGATCNYYEPALLDLIQHPFFEAGRQTSAASRCDPLLPNGDFGLLSPAGKRVQLRPAHRYPVQLGGLGCDATAGRMQFFSVVDRRQ